MGLIEVEFSPLIKWAMDKGPTEIEGLLRKMALIIDRQDQAIKSVRWSDETLKNVDGIGEVLFLELQTMRKEADGPA